MAFPRSQKKVGAEHEIQASKSPILPPESPFLEKPAAEGKQKGSLIIYFPYILNRILGRPSDYNRQHMK